MAQTPKLNLEKPIVGGDVNAWGALLNANFDKLDEANVLTVDTAGEGYFFGGFVYPASNVNSTIVAGGGQIIVMQFVLPFRANFNRAVTRLKTVGGAGTKYGVALYNAAKELIVESGALDANTLAINNTTIALTRLEPGVYWFAQTSDSITANCTAFNQGEAINMLTNLDTARQGRATTTAPTPGTFPATLGAIVTTTARNPVVTLFGLE